MGLPLRRRVCVGAHLRVRPGPRVHPMPRVRPGPRVRSARQGKHPGLPLREGKQRPFRKSSRGDLTNADVQLRS